MEAIALNEISLRPIAEFTGKVLASWAIIGIANTFKNRVWEYVQSEPYDAAAVGGVVAEPGMGAGAGAVAARAALVATMSL